MDKSEQRFWSHWNKETKEFFLQFSFKLSDPRNTAGAPRPPPPAMVIALIHCRKLPPKAKTIIDHNHSQTAASLLNLGACSSQACSSSLGTATSSSGFQWMISNKQIIINFLSASRSIWGEPSNIRVRTLFRSTFPEINVCWS